VTNDTLPTTPDARPSLTDYEPLTVRQAAMLARTLDVIMDDVSSWDQAQWGRRDECGTHFCLAGHCAVTVLRSAPIWYPLGDGDDVDEMMTSVDVLGAHVPVDVVAARAFGMTTFSGLPDARAESLFAESRSLRRLVELVYLYTDGRVDRFDRYAEVIASHPDVALRDRDVEDYDATRLNRRVTLLRRTTSNVDVASWAAAHL
jgi:hypothetical protein